jgi:hypothetical protein
VRHVLFSHFGCILPDLLHSLRGLRGDFKLFYICVADRRGTFWRNFRISVYAGAKYFCIACHFKAYIVRDFDSAVCAVFRARNNGSQRDG